MGDEENISGKLSESPAGKKSNYSEHCARAPRWTAPDTFDTIGKITLRGSRELPNRYLAAQKNKDGEHAVKLLFHACAGAAFDLPESASAPERGDVLVINVCPSPGGERHPPNVSGAALFVNLESFPASFAINYISHSAEAEPCRRGKKQMNVAVVHGAVFFISFPSPYPPSRLLKSDMCRD